MLLVDNRFLRVPIVSTLAERDSDELDDETEDERLGGVDADAKNEPALLGSDWDAAVFSGLIGIGELAVGDSAAAGTGAWAMVTTPCDALSLPPVSMDMFSKRVAIDGGLTPLSDVVRGFTDFVPWIVDER